MARSSKRKNTIIRGVIPPLMIVLILTLSTFSAFALVPDLPSNCEKLGIIPNQTQDGELAYEWYKLVQTCDQCGASLYAFSYSTTFSDIPPNTLFFAAQTAYASSSYRVSESGQIVADGSEAHNPSVLLTPHTVAADKPNKWELMGWQDPIVYIDDTPTTLNGYYFVSHNTKDVEVSTVTIFASINPDHQAYDTIYDAFDMVKAVNPNRTYLANVAIAFFAVPIYQEAIDDYYTERYLDYYNQGQINGTQNTEAFELIPYTFDSVALAISSTFNQISFYGISLMYIVFLFVVAVMVILFLKLRG